MLVQWWFTGFLRGQFTTEYQMCMVEHGRSAPMLVLWVSVGYVVLASYKSVAGHNRGYR
jgi:hypothetical protein